MRLASNACPLARPLARWIPEFVSLLDVWKRLIDLGADPTEEFQDETAAMVAEQTKSAVRLCPA